MGRCPFILIKYIINIVRREALGGPVSIGLHQFQLNHGAATIMSLIQSAKLNGHDPYRYLKEVLERIPTQPASRLTELLPHRWQPII